MQTELIQPTFFQLFDQSAEAKKHATQISKIDVAPQVLSFVTERQREVMRTSPFAYLLAGKTLEEIKAIDDDLGNKLYKKGDTADGARKLELWRKTVSSAQTIAMEKEYRNVDERFCSPEKGVFYLVGKNRARTTVTYKYEPYYFDSSNNRTHLPVHHLEFRSKDDAPTEISETGYRSHFFTYVPYSFVKDFADFMIQLLRIHLNVTAPIIFEGREYAFDPSILPKPKTKPKSRKCPECNTKMKHDECPNCNYYEPDEEDFSDDDFEDA